MRKLGAIVTNWNGNPFAVPNCKMLRSAGLERIIVLQGVRPLSDYNRDFPERYPAVATDDSRERLAAMGLEMVEQRATHFGNDLYNQGLELLQDVDVALRFDTDMFMSPEDLRRIVQFVRYTDYDCYRLDFAACTINYYYDFDHGICRNGLEVDPMAVSTRGRFEWVLHYPTAPGKEYVINWPNFVVHHFRGWKGAMSRWILDPNGDSRWDGLTTTGVVQKFGNNGEFYKAPAWLRHAIETQTWTF